MGCIYYPTAVYNRVDIVTTCWNIANRL